MEKRIVLTPEMTHAIPAAPLPNFHAMSRRYNESGFRRQVLDAWAGDDADWQVAVMDRLYLNSYPTQ